MGKNLEENLDQLTLSFEDYNSKMIQYLMKNVSGNWLNNLFMHN